MDVFAPLRLPPAPPTLTTKDQSTNTDEAWLAAITSREQSLSDVVEDQRLAFIRRLQEVSRRELAVIAWEHRLQEKEEELLAKERQLKQKEAAMTRSTTATDTQRSIGGGTSLSWESRLAIAKQRRGIV